MLGKDYFKIEVNFELSNERLKSLVFFYESLIGKDALVVYEYLVLNGNKSSFEELNELLSSLNMNVDLFEDVCNKLNEYKLLRTLQNENKYIFVLVAPLDIKNFIKDNLLVRAFILKTSGKHYQELIANIAEDSNHSEYKDISKTMELNLNAWSNEQEQYLNNKNKKDEYEFNTYFNVTTFLKDISTNLLPMRFRTKENMQALATIADLYNIGYDTMRGFIPKVFNNDENKFDVNYLVYLCQKSKTNYYKVSSNNYEVPCKLYLESLQDGKEVSEFDMKIIFKLSNDYHLPTSVINVVLEHCLRNCDNRLIEKYVYGVASDLHRNNIKTATDALNRLDKYNGNRKQEDNAPKYDDSKNNNLTSSEIDELLSLRGK